jgi:hypothetical protein
MSFKRHFISKSALARFRLFMAGMNKKFVLSAPGEMRRALVCKPQKLPVIPPQFRVFKAFREPCNKRGE